MRIQRCVCSALHAATKTLDTVKTSLCSRQASGGTGGAARLLYTSHIVGVLQHHRPRHGHRHAAANGDAQVHARQCCPRCQLRRTLQRVSPCQAVEPKLAVGLCRLPFMALAQALTKAARSMCACQQGLRRQLLRVVAGPGDWPCCTCCVPVGSEYAWLWPCSL